MDLDSLLNVEISLDSLFSRVEANQSEATDFPNQPCTHPLASIHLITTDVRDDTVLRFVANRWAKILKARRKLISPKALKALDSIQETVARRFIASWARNPSQTLLLKKGLQLFPSPLLLCAVWEPLIEKLSRRLSENTSFKIFTTTCSLMYGSINHI
jgi:hypothetical protein